MKVVPSSRNRVLRIRETKRLDMGKANSNASKPTPHISKHNHVMIHKKSEGGEASEVRTPRSSRRKEGTIGYIENSPCLDRYSLTLKSVYHIIFTTFIISIHLDIDTGYSSFGITKQGT
jgi:hypothetical protein